MTSLPLPGGGRTAAEAYVTRHLAHLTCDEVPGIAEHGGQVAAEAALDAFDVTGYARRRNEVFPRNSGRVARRPRLSPYIRHGLLSLPDVWVASQVVPAGRRSATSCCGRSSPGTGTPVGRRTRRSVRHGSPGSDPAGSAASSWMVAATGVSRPLPG